MLCQKYDTLTKLDVSFMSFRWVDGILVQALEKGFWLHLENVNLCSSSVLDRLNPLLENGGDLILTEWSMSSEGSDEHRIIKAHPNFRLFLSMDPSHGEISRAMRNRCVEFCLSTVSVSEILGDDLSHDTQSTMETTDALECMWDSGIRSSALARSAVANRQSIVSIGACYNKNVCSLRFLKRWTQAIIAGIHRGIPLLPWYKFSLKIAYSYNAEEQDVNPLLAINVKWSQTYAMVEGCTFRRLELLKPSKARLWTEASLLKIFSSAPETLRPLGLVSSRGNYSMLSNKYRSPQWSLDQRVKGISNYLTVEYAIKPPTTECSFSIEYF